MYICVFVHQAGCIPLLFSCIDGDLDVATLLLDRGADINCKNIVGYTHKHTHGATTLLVCFAILYWDLPYDHKISGFTFAQTHTHTHLSTCASTLPVLSWHNHTHTWTHSYTGREKGELMCSKENSYVAHTKTYLHTWHIRSTLTHTYEYQSSPLFLSL